MVYGRSPLRSWAAAFRTRFKALHLCFTDHQTASWYPSFLISFGLGSVQPNGLTVHWRLLVFWAQLTWTLAVRPRSCFAVFNRFDKSMRKRRVDMGASPWQTLRHVVLPI